MYFNIFWGGISPKWLHTFLLPRNKNPNKNRFQQWTVICVLSRGRWLPHRGITNWAPKLTSSHHLTRVFVEHCTKDRLPHTLPTLKSSKPQAHLQVYGRDFHNRLFGQSRSTTCWRGYMKENSKVSLTQTSLQNSSSPQIRLQTWTMWQQPDCLPCDSHTPCPSLPPSCSAPAFSLREKQTRPPRHHYEWWGM